MENITPKEKLIEEAKDIQSFLEITLSDNIEEAKERATELSVYNARTGKMLADAKYHLNDRMQEDIIKLLEKLAGNLGATATTQNALVKSLCKDDQYLVDWLERINRSTVHQIDIIRTFISLEKELLRNSPMQR